MKIFRFSEYQYSQEACHEWYEWFKEKGVPAAIVFRNHHPENTSMDQYSVWREGEDLGIKTKNNNLWYPKSEIIVSCHGFKGKE